jgi:hypothetical protein
MLRHIIVAFLVLCAWPVLGQPRSLLVGNEGTDSPSCGGFDNKCRSISQAIRNSAEGDTVFVEAGVYGDLNRNGIIGELGEEAQPSDQPPCQCLITIDKRISVLSERGAAATIIDASTTALAAVRIARDGAGAVFGYTGMGFTVVTAATAPWGGIWMSLPPTSRRAEPSATIAGNRVVGSVQDLKFGQHAGILAQGTPGSEIYDNEVSGFFIGIAANASRIIRNVVTRNGVGVRVANVSNPDGTPVAVPAVVADNVIADNEVGIDLGFGVGVLAITGNDILFNKEQGIRYDLKHPLQPALNIQDNNIIGNGHDPGISTHCGILNDSNSFVWATNNYWGALGTPDRVCNGSGSSTQIDPVRLVPDSRVSN